MPGTAPATLCTYIIAICRNGQLDEVYGSLNTLIQMHASGKITGYEKPKLDLTCIFNSIKLFLCIYLLISYSL